MEEGPPIAVGPETMREMELAAAKLALMVDYTHAGTVEYLFLEETGEVRDLQISLTHLRWSPCHFTLLRLQP